MEFEIRPEATEPERAVLLHVLALLDDGQTPPGEAWRRTALDGDEDYAVALRPRSSAGAARA